jgi:DNA-binding LytR/AlgR family response regulator
MMQFIVNSLEESRNDKFIIATGFSSKDEMIDYLRDEHSANITLPLEHFTTISGVASNTNYIAAHFEEDLVLLNPNDVCFMEAALKKTKIYTDTGTYISSKPLNYFEQKLKTRNFFRSHKSYLINVSKVERCVQMINYNYEVVFKNMSARAEISRPKVKVFKKLVE